MQNRGLKNKQTKIVKTMLSKAEKPFIAQRTESEVGEKKNP